MRLLRPLCLPCLKAVSEAAKSNVYGTAFLSFGELWRNSTKTDTNFGIVGEISSETMSLLDLPSSTPHSSPLPPPSSSYANIYFEKVRPVFFVGVSYGGLNDLKMEVMTIKKLQWKQLLYIERNQKYTAKTKWFVETIKEPALMCQHLKRTTKRTRNEHFPKWCKWNFLL